MKTYNFNVRTLHAICFVLALGLLVAGLQAFFVANAATLAGAASVYPGHAIAKMACGLFLGACAWFDALEKTLPATACAKTDLKHRADAVLNQLTASGSGCTSGVLHSLAESHRARLEELAMHCLGSAALPHEERFTPKEAGARLREAIDALVTPSATVEASNTCKAYEAAMQAANHNISTAYSAMRTMQTAISKPATASVNGHTTTATPSKGQKVMPEDIEAAIAHEFYFSGDDGVKGAAGGVFGSYTIIRANAVAPEQTMKLTTFCVLVLKNGFKVVGISACADPAIYSAEEGYKWARKDAINKVWPLLGYDLCNKLASQSA